jgi:hypothetical protein
MLALQFLRDFPLAAFVPAALFVYLALRCRRPLVWIAALIWTAYGVYELLMQAQVLCSDECTRTDLLFIDPFLLVLTVAALLSAMRGRKEIDLS